MLSNDPAGYSDVLLTETFKNQDDLAGQWMLRKNLRAHTNNNWANEQANTACNRFFIKSRKKIKLVQLRGEGLFNRLTATTNKLIFMLSKFKFSKRIQ
jgi:hypothetical protein